MFSIEQIKEAHSKVKSGADFPGYIQDLKVLGVTNYETFVTDGRTTYYGVNDLNIESPAKYKGLHVADVSNETQFRSDLKAHQLGKTDYITFCNDCARSGIEKWEVRIDQMTCIYYDMSGKKILIEEIPH